jgi:hypothetical protein
MYEFYFEGDFKSGFSQAVDELLTLDLPMTFRIGQVEILTEAYFEQTGQKPDPFQLERLADFILRDDLSDPHPDKVTNTEFPILSEGQVKLRNGRENSWDVSIFSPNRKHKLNGTRRGVARDSYFVRGNDQYSAKQKFQIEE